MKKSGTKIFAITFLILALIAFTIGTTLAVIILQNNPAASAQEQAGRELVAVVLFLPLIISYVMFALFDLIGTFASVCLIKSKSKAMGITTLVLDVIMLISAIILFVLLLAI